MSGSEIVYYKDLNEFRIWTHSKGVNMDDEDTGFLKGNMLYKEDKWYIQIPSINFVQKNEPNWSVARLGNPSSNKIPVELQQSNFVKANEIGVDNTKAPLNDRGLVFWVDGYRESEAKLKDKYIKIRVRYSGNDLAVISAIKTLYSISYA